MNLDPTVQLGGASTLSYIPLFILERPILVKSNTIIMALLHYIENNNLHAILMYNPISFEIAERLIQKPCGPTPLPFYVKQMIVVAIILTNQLAHFVLDSIFTVQYQQ